MKSNHRQKYRIGMSRSEFLSLCKARYTTSIVQMAVKYKIIKRRPCAVCGSSETAGHHFDYSRVLDVIWLCQSHHIKEHSILGWGRQNVGVSVWLKSFLKGKVVYREILRAS